MAVRPDPLVHRVLRVLRSTTRVMSRLSAISLLARLSAMHTSSWLMATSTFGTALAGRMSVRWSAPRVRLVPMAVLVRLVRRVHKASAVLVRLVRLVLKASKVRAAVSVP